MTIQIARGRQFALGDADATLFTKSGRSGEFLSKAADKLVEQKLTVVLDRGGAPLKLASKQEWEAFLTENAANKESTARFAERFGITFDDFVNAMDDAAASDEHDVTLDFSPTSELAQAMSLDKVEADYGTKATEATLVNLTGENGAVGQAQGPVQGVMGPEILATATSGNWDRDRTEMESWADFQRTDGASDAFKKVAGPAPFAKLHEPKWNDAEAMAMADQFSLPLHLEVKGTNPDGTIKFQGGSELFRDTYYDDRNGSLEKAGASLRARVRYDDDPPFAVNRVLIQAKEGRAIDGDASAVHKFEKRWEGTWTDEAKAKRLLVTGKEENGSVLAVSQKVYKLASDKGTLPADGQLRLEPKYIVLQKRTRTHLQLDSVSQVQTRRAALQAEMDAATAAGTPIDPAMTRFAAKLDEQIAFLTDSQKLLSKYGQFLSSGECFIVSADRYSVYDPSGVGELPNDIASETGLIAKGPFHVEAEWDSQSSDPFEKAVKAVNEKLAVAPRDTPENIALATELETDLASLEAARARFRKDVAQTVEVIKQRMLAQGMVEEPSKLSKDQRAAELVRKTKRSVNWL